ncbi:MAG: SUMF1/EgtB/PvdO family nonheme iron enzyme, partial [Gammaproteobacteria bacterium]|nr:SUMF1/EgtB/PvdO family nonheme iron enzyme [Gammaproteobacteria bacterium]
MRRAIGGLIAVLRRFKIEAGTEELADWIWYAAQRGASIERTEKPFESEKNSPAEKAQSALARKPQSAPAKKPQSAPAEKPQSVLAEKPAEPGPVRTETRHEPAAEVYSPPLGETEAEREQKNDLPFRSPGGRALPHPLEITQALRPLIRHVPSADGLVLNEATTAQQIAQSDVWLPIFKKKSARWLELLLVIEESPSMRLWHHTVKELRRLLEQQGAFRDVRTRILKTGAKTQAVGLYTEGAKTSVNYRELINPVRKRLIFVITDCISPAWQSEPLLQWLDAWGKVHPLTIVQMLPQTLWPQTRLRNARFVMVNTPGPAAPNRFLKSGQISLSPWLRKPDELKKFKQIAHPLVTLEPGFLENWAKAVAGAGDIAIPAFLLKPERISGTRQPQTEIDEDKRLRDFRAAASPTAFRLAVYLAAAPLRLPIMRLVQRVMLPESRQVHLAEFFLSGLIKRAGTGEETGNPDEIDYDFIGSLRDKLLDAGLVTDAVSVQESVSEYIAEHYGSAIDFQALIANPEEAKNIQVASGHEKFAKVTRKVLERLGPNYSKVIGQLSEFRPFHDLLSDRTPGPAMIFLAGGFFRMGDDKSGWDNEKPAHLVILNEFSVGQYPVTFEEYDLFCEAVEREKPNDEGWGRGKRPVINVSWDDAVAYCEWLSEQTGQTYRLLTEAEWEYACRAGSETAYGFGNDEKQLAEYAWYDENREKGSVHPVGKKKPNGWGVYDMLGNVLEWVQDWYGDYSKDTQTNPNGLESGSGRVVRGGSWKLVAKTCRSTYRGSWIQDDRNHSLGFRLARTGPLSSSPFTLPDMTRLLDGTFNTSVSQLPISRDHVRDFWVDSIMKESSRIWATNIEEFTGSYGRQVKSELLKAQALAILRGCEIKRVFVYSIQEILDEKKRKMLLDVMMAQSLLGIDVYAIRDVDFYGLIDYEKSIGGKDFIVINHRALYITHFKEREVSSTELMVPENVRELKKVEKA